MMEKKMGKSESEKALEMIYEALKENPELLKLARAALGMSMDPKKPLPWKMWLKNGKQIPDQALAEIAQQAKESACDELENHFRESLGIVFSNREDLKEVLKMYLKK